MKKQLVIASITLASLSSFSQGSLEIFALGSTDEISGTTYDYVSGEEDQEKKFQVKNVGDSDLNTRIERVKIMELDMTGDALCWGINCYSEGFVTPDDPFLSPDPVMVYAHPDSSTVLFTYHHTNDIAGCAQYRYYVINHSTEERLDSIDVHFCSTVSLEEEQGIEVTIFPNPADELITFKLAEKEPNTMVEIYNAVGEKVQAKQLNELVNEVDLTSLPNGVYYYSLLRDGKAVKTEKLVVQH